MTTWNLIDEATAQSKWDRWLNTLGETCLYQTYGWGSYKRQIGQPQTRIVFFTEPESPALMMQGHLKRLPFRTAILWVPGGPAGNLEILTPESMQEIAKLIGCRHLLIRASIMRERNARDVTTLRRFGHREALKRINSGLSMNLPIPSDGQDALSNASSNWKHNLRRGQKRASASRLQELNPKEIADTYRTLQDAKGIGEQFSEPTISAMINQFRDNLIVFGTRDGTGKLVAMRACICVGTVGWDIWAAATEDSRKNYSSHLLLQELLKECQRKGIALYELSGIDPKTATGVYNFKRGTGATHVEYLGEWDFGCQKLGRFLNFYLRGLGIAHRLKRSIAGQ